ncbi:MAG TPA: LysR family transcriptional regulator [Trinickia sp.]|jgi:DNA-binding transcriptional LysR family regulator|uniref:LysR family transcriptional regulator n=1 Tax=Trinickia sp. TaxID=2571163 RepID=UPI002C838963|nr:LysR family transcriptional regulator [Trinickia sp.]HTI18511.1 LysR family transcriptional regulator [Trinickia sp.]
MLRELKTFLAVVRFGSFASAGANIGLTQSAVSAQMQRLEQDLGYALFDRSGRAATLNAAGRQAVAFAEDMLSTYARLANEGGVSERSGLLRVGAIASAQASYLVPAIERFRRKAPGWRIRVIPGVSLNLLAQVDSGEIDVAVIIKPPFALPAELKWRVLTTEPFVLAVPRKLRGTPWRELLKTQPFIRYDRNSFGGRLVDRFLKKVRVTVHDVVELDELQGIVGLVAQGVGVALVPMAAALQLPRSVTALTLGEDTFVREIGLVERHTGEQASMAAGFSACL